MICLGFEPRALAGAEPPGQVAAAPLLQHVRDLVAQALASGGGREIVEPGRDVHMLGDGDAPGPGDQWACRVGGDGHVAGGCAECAPHLCGQCLRGPTGAQLRDSRYRWIWPRQRHRDTSASRRRRPQLVS